MSNGVDKVGCAFGRDLSSKVVDIEKKYEAKHVESSLLLQAHKEILKDHELFLQKLEMRLDDLEKKLVWLLGSYTVVGGIIGYMVARMF